MKKLYLLHFLFFFYITSESQILEEVLLKQSAKKYAEENIKKGNYFLLKSNYGYPYSYNQRICAEARDSLVGIIESKYQFHSEYFGGGCIANPRVISYADSVNQIMIVSLNKNNKNNNWYADYEEEEKNILMEHEFYLDSLLKNEFIKFELPFNYKMNKKNYLKLYHLAKFMLDNPMMFIQIVVYPPSSHYRKSFYKYEEIRDCLVKNFGIEKNRFLYEEVENHHLNRNCIRAKFKQN